MRTLDSGVQHFACTPSTPTTSLRFKRCLNVKFNLLNLRTALETQVVFQETLSLNIIEAAITLSAQRNYENNLVTYKRNFKETWFFMRSHSN